MLLKLLLKSVQILFLKGSYTKTKTGRKILPENLCQTLQLGIGKRSKLRRVDHHCEMR
jgi:hypothetical protein